MKPLPNYNFDSITSSGMALEETEKHIRLLVEHIRECDDVLTLADKTQLVNNILWIKRFYETAERLLINDK